MSTLILFSCSMPSKYYMSSCVTLHIDFTRTFFCSLGTGPQWYNKHKTRLLFASRRHDRSRARKYAGNIADGLRSSPWKRAQDPGKMTHRLFGTNNNKRNCVHLVHPSKIASLQPEKLAVHKILAFLGKKICCFVHDFIQTGSRAWICLFQMGCIISCNRIKSIGFSDGWCSPIMTQLAWRRIGPKCCRFSVVWKLASGIIWGSRLCTANPSETRKTMLVGWTVSSSSRHRPTTLAVAGTLICPSRMRGTDVCLCCAEWNLGQIAVRFKMWTALWWTNSSIMPRAGAFSKTIVF